MQYKIRLYYIFFALLPMFATCSYISASDAVQKDSIGVANALSIQGYIVEQKILVPK